MEEEHQANLARIALELVQVHLKEPEAHTIAEILVGQGYTDLKTAR